MNYTIHIENLGAIKEADFLITPLTVIAGENGTGKSFVTKFLYSVLNSVNIDVYSNHTISTIKRLDSTFFQIIKIFNDIDGYEKVSDELAYLDTFNQTLKNISKLIVEIESDYYELSDELLVGLKEKIDFYVGYIYPKLSEFIKNTHEEDNHDVSSENLNLSLKFLRTFRGPDIILERARNLVDELSRLLANPQESYLRVLSDYITDELKENFQISEIQNLISYGATDSSFIINEVIEVYINRDKGLNINFQSQYLSGFEKINHIIFFESPVYWRLPPTSDGLDKINNRHRYEVLTGIPKYFYDLKKLLFTNFKEGERPEFIVDSANRLQSYLKGHFKASDNDLIFENSQGHSIPKNLVSFGMTNIGIIQAVLSKNIINSGSFIFIDEPESNLHPEWQNILAHTLTRLAENGVYIIVTSHSTDMLKALDINSKELSIKYKVSTYYLETDGKLLDMDNENLSQIEQARQKLLEPYDDLTIRGYALD